MTGILILMSILYYNRTLAIIHSKVSDIAEKNISQTAGLFNLMLQGYNSLSKSLNSNYELTRLLQETESNPAVGVINERTITNIIGAAYYSRSEVVGIHILSKDGKVYSYERQFAGVIDNNYAQTDWYKKLGESSGNMVWLGLYPGSPINTMQQQDKVFVFGRKLYDLTNHKEIGILVIETNPSPIMEALSNVSISPGTRVYILGEDNKIIASSGQKGAKRPELDQLPRPSPDENIVVDSTSNQLIVAANTSMAGWTIYGLTPKKDIRAEVYQTTKFLIIVVLMLIILSTVLASIVSRNIASPLKLLIREMKKVEMGNFSGSVNVNSFDEINSLVSSFNRMVHRMDELIETIKISTVSEKNAQLQALQSQVNPHFLYNTLDMIYWMLDEQENERLSRVVLSLSQMFRYSSNWEEASRTTLGRELEQIRHYLTIIETRLGGRLHTEIAAYEVWLSVPLPKMTIQPIIENAVKYGLEPQGSIGFLKVSTEAHEGKLQIIIEDNGVGMDGPTLERVRETLSQRQSGASSSGVSGPRRGIGLRNVHDRIVMMFGEACGLNINSEMNQGTTVVITIPIPPKGETDIEHIDRG
ncbi:HAMP domain-containing protein [Paenibacillus sp. HJL G12]|uniref:histidine kinase n=2 Tax=Paenibacillus dendrobii TaxID=2691084 RepID=A0A7X3IES9_9BACL|nr:sensor histidine kinase [Paenibacillus dendrobii]MWV42253.1 HAMP domain-containing protein [Paenibacillus dendrobii]